MSFLSKLLWSNGSSTTLQSWRERPPSSYSLKIQNLSQFEKSTSSTDGKYESRFFSSGGYNWRMIIYPKGNDKDEGSGFVSIYVEIDSTRHKSTPPSEMFADVRFFVYNKKEKKYLVIQDVEPKSFRTLRMVQGNPQFLPLDTLNDPKNGYIFEGGQCEFGVDVIVAPIHTNWEDLSFNEELPCPKFSWILKNFLLLKENVYASSSFSMGGKKWILQLYPKGDGIIVDGKWLSIYLLLADGETLKDYEKIFAGAHVRVVDPFGNNHVTKEVKRWHIKSNLGWGYPQFVSVAELSKAYLNKEGTLNVEIEFEVVSENKYSHP